MQIWNEIEHKKCRWAWRRRRRAKNGDCLYITGSHWFARLVRSFDDLVWSSSQLGILGIRLTSISLTFNEIQIDIKHTCHFYGHLFNLYKAEAFARTMNQNSSIRSLFIGSQIYGTMHFFPNVFKVAHLSQIKLGWHVKTFTHIPFLWSVHHEIRAQRSHSILFLFIAVLFAITEQADWMSIVWRTFSLIFTLAFFSLFIFTRKAIEHDDIPIPGQVIATA